MKSERDRERDRDRDRDRETQSDRQTDRDRERDRQRETQTERDTERVNVKSGLKVISVQISSVRARQSDRLDKSGQVFILCLFFYYYLSSR